MPEYSRPNLSIPSTLWGEVKVAAFRRGVRPVEVVIECLSERFAVPAKAEPRKDGGGGQPVSRGRTGGSTPPTAAKPDAATVSEFSCKVCGKPTKGAFLCPTCETK